MTSSACAKVLRAYVDRLCGRGSDRLVSLAREIKARKGEGKGLTISSKLEAALLEELRARAALALVEGRLVELPPESLHGVTCKGVRIQVDPEQFQDAWPTGREKPRASEPRQPQW